jgi:fructose-1,6-bisphosphatase/inositol monophosphatase family enzyme
MEILANTNPILARIREALKAPGAALADFVPGAVASSQKSSGRGPVTEADRAVNRVLRDTLLCKGEGWPSEESVDNFDRLKKSRVWIAEFLSSRCRNGQPVHSAAGGNLAPLP